MFNTATDTHDVTASAPAGTDSFFPVELRPAEVDGRQVPGFVAVQRQDTGAVLAFHRQGYRLIRNAEVFSAFEEALQASSLDLSRLSIDDDMTHGGARTVRTYRLPAYQVEVMPGDLVGLQLKVINSYDGAFAFSSLIGGQRLICKNGMIAIEQFAQSYGRHTKGFDVTLAASALQQTLQVFEQHAQHWQRWSQISVSEVQAEQVITALPQGTEQLTQRLLGYWQQERQELGATVWALFNALTYWSTHQSVRQSSQANQASIVLAREARVRSLLNSTVFRQLVSVPNDKAKDGLLCHSATEQEARWVLLVSMLSVLFVKKPDSNVLAVVQVYLLESLSFMAMLWWHYSAAFIISGYQRLIGVFMCLYRSLFNVFLSENRRQTDTHMSINLGGL